MNFFAAQDIARKNTGRLILLFVLAVLSLIVMTNFLVMLVFGLISFKSGAGANSFTFSWDVFGLVGLGVVLVVAGGTWYKIGKLSGGGDVVALMLGGEPLFDDESDFHRKRLINVVDEMAIASGTAVPQVYILNEPKINAFAAGFSPSDAVIAVTEGAIQNLTREQLQGIVAHEFSHILNGDIRINIRLVGILHGILLLGLIGRQLLEGTRSSRKGSGGAIALGVGLICVGYVGTFFGNLIKAAVSRQREFLADAAAVQFTRNPDGIGGALLRIGSAGHGSILQHPKSEELSHAFFSQGVKFRFTSLFATHPPLPVRIQRILPGWDGNFPAPAKLTDRANAWDRKRAGVAAQPEMVSGFTAQAEGDREQLMPGEMDFATGSALLYSIAEPYRKAAKGPFGCRAVVCFLVLSEEDEVRERQLDYLQTDGDRGIYAEILRLLRVEQSLERRQILPLLELAMPGFRSLSRKQCHLFLQNLEQLIREDGKLTLFEWCLRTIVVNYLREYFTVAPKRKMGRTLSANSGAIGLLLSTFVHTIGHQGMEKSVVFQHGADILQLGDLALLPREELSLKKLDAAVAVLRQLKPQAKGKLFGACRAITLADGEVTVVEKELLRAVAASLAIPVPPPTPS